MTFIRWRLSDDTHKTEISWFCYSPMNVLGYDETRKEWERAAKKENPVHLRRTVLLVTHSLVLFFTCTSAWLGRKPFIHLSRKRMIWWVNKTTSLLRLQWECIRPDDLGNYNNIGHTGTYGSSETSETVILAGYSSRCDTDAAQMYLRRKVTDKWGAARGTPRCGIIRKMIHFHYKSRSSLPSVKSEG